MTRPPLPRPGSLGRIQYAGVDMYAYADTCVDAATGSMAEAQAYLMTENKALRDRLVEVRREHAAEVDRMRVNAAALRKDAERGRHMIEHGCWHRGEEQTHLAVLVPQGSDLSCYAMREAAIDAARAALEKP